ncbi:MAG: discoidin domain-containing protein [Clostridia bacterium]
MKKILLISLSIILAMSMFSVLVFASDVSLEITGTKTNTEAEFLLKIANNGEESADLKVYVASYNIDGTLNEAKTHKISVEPNIREAFSFTAPLKGGNAKIFVWDGFLRPSSPLFTSDECVEAEKLNPEKLNITTLDVWASYEPESANPVTNVADGNLDTKWTASGSTSENPNWVTAYLGGEFVLSKFGVAFGLGIEREYIYSVAASEDGENFVHLTGKKTSEKTNSVQYVSLPPVKAKYIRLNVYGRTDNGAWTQVTEIEAYGAKDNTGVLLMENSQDEDWNISAMDERNYTDYEPSLGEKLYAENTEDGLFLYDDVDRNGKVSGEKIAVSTVTASQTPEEKNKPENTIDGDTSTIWTAKGVTDTNTATLTLDLSDSFYLTKAGIGFDMGDSRTYAFDISTSTDNRNFVTVVEKRTSASTNDIQYFEFPQTEARYVKYTFYQRTDSNNNGWIRISEVEAFGNSEPIEGAGGVLAQKRLTIPSDRGNFEISFDLNLSGNVYFSGISITDDTVTGGADLDNYAALQLRFDNDGNKVKINRIISNYFNEGTPISLFENSFSKDEYIHFDMLVSPKDRTISITASDSTVSETQLVYFNYADDELTRNSSWTWLEAKNMVFNTGAGAKAEMTVTNFNLRQSDSEKANLTGVEPVNGIIRLEEVRLEDDPTTSAFYGKYVYHSGADEILAVEAEKNPANTRFVERKGLIGVGVSLEAVSMPGYFALCDNGGIYLKKLENTGVFYANATFIKTEAENVGYYTGKTYSYQTYLNRDKYIYDTTARYEMHGDLKAWSMYNQANGTFYLRSEASAYVCDNFLGNSISSQWWTNFPWKSNHPTNDSYNYSALITEKNVIVENGELFLKATKINGWPTNKDGDTGIDYNGSYGKGWTRWKGYVGVVSIQNKVFNRQCYVEGSFKQPESPIGYWNAFWLSGRDSWPPEIDIFETLSSTYGANAWHTAIHGEGNKNNLLGKQTSSVNVTTDYHTFAMDWGYDYIKFYVDGKIFARAHNKDTLNFQKNVRLILNTGIGGWEAEPDDTMVWDDGLRCKYIRSFQY